MALGKTAQRWRCILGRCVGRTESIRGDKTNIITYKGGVSWEEKLMLPRLNDSAYFSEDETAETAITDGRLSKLYEQTDINDYCNPSLADNPALNNDERLTCNIYRESSIQDRSLRITRQRHQKVALMKKTRKLTAVEAVSDSSSTSDDESAEHGVPHLSGEPCTNLVSRSSSVQMRRWEIRRRRKDLLHRRRSKGYHGETCCDNPVVTP